MTQAFGRDSSIPPGTFTDLYELTMGQTYVASGMEGIAVFELFYRELPPCRRYVMSAGLGNVLDFLEGFRFDETDLRFLRSEGKLSESFLRRLTETRFTGDVNAVPEGTPVFPGEPVLQVIAPILEGQLVETYVLNQIHFQSVIASKAARVMEAAAGRTVVDFGSRRSHGVDAALHAARVAYVAGAAGTSNVLAGKRFGIPLFGTMAHSFVQAHDRELTAFESFERQFPEATLLVDTYDTLDGVRNVIRLAEALGSDCRIRGIRLDSGDLGELAVQSRRMFDEAGLGDIRIFASGGLDEHRIADLIDRQAPIDGFGVGTKLCVASDAPDLDFAYKLVEYEGRGRTKRSPSKEILPGRKQVFRRLADGIYRGDTLALASEEPPGGEPLLRPVMRDGAVLPGVRESIAESRERAIRERSRLPDVIRRLGVVSEDDRTCLYPVDRSEGLLAEAARVRQRLG